MSRLGLQILSLVCLLALASLAKAETYTWTDKNGGIHFTDNPYELPEPQRSRALKQQEENRKRTERERKATPQTGARRDNDGRKIRHESYRPPDKQRDTVEQTRDSGERLPGGPKVAPLNENKKKRWKARATKARNKTAQLQAKCQSLENSRDTNQRQHLLFGRPGALADSNKAAENLEKCQEKLKKAKHFLDIELPDMARKAGVPTRWVK